MNLSNLTCSMISFCVFMATKVNGKMERIAILTDHQLELEMPLICDFASPDKLQGIITNNYE